MYFYQIKYEGIETKGSIQLTHNKLFSKEEFDEMFVEAVLDFLLNVRECENYSLDYEEDEILEEDRSRLTKKYHENPGLDRQFTNLENYINKTGFKWITNFFDIHKEVAQIIVDKYGFKILEYDRDICVDGEVGIVSRKVRQFYDRIILFDKVREEYWKRKGKK